MHIAQMIDTLRVAGAERLQITFARAIQNRDVRLTVISLRNDDTPFRAILEDMGIRIVALAGRTMLDPFRISRLVQLFRRERFNVVQAHLTTANVIGSIAGKLTGTPVIATLHLPFWENPNDHFLRPKLETFALRHLATRVLAVGHEVAETHQWRAGNKKIDVIWNAIEPISPISAGERESTRAEIMGDTKRPFIIAVGRLAYHKAFGDLLEAFSIVHQQLPESFLAIAGEGEQRAELQAKISEFGLHGHVVLLGQRSDIPRLLLSADLYVSSSLLEGQSVAALEAMSAGLPVIVTDTGDTEYFVGENMGIVVPKRQPDRLATAMLELLSNPNMIRDFGVAAQEFVNQQFHAEQWVNQLLALYKTIQR